MAKKGFVGFRCDEKVKSDAEIVAALENMSASEWYELTAKQAVHQWEKKHPGELKR